MPPEAGCVILAVLGLESWVVSMQSTARVSDPSSPPVWNLHFLFGEKTFIEDRDRFFDILAGGACAVFTRVHTGPNSGLLGRHSFAIFVCTEAWLRLRYDYIKAQIWCNLSKALGLFYLTTTCGKGNDRFSAV